MPLEEALKRARWSTRFFSSSPFSVLSAEGRLFPWRDRERSSRHAIKGQPETRERFPGRLRAHVSPIDPKFAGPSIPRRAASPRRGLRDFPRTLCSLEPPSGLQLRMAIYRSRGLLVWYLACESHGYLGGRDMKNILVLLSWNEWRKNWEILGSFRSWDYRFPIIGLTGTSRGRKGDGMVARA